MEQNQKNDLKGKQRGIHLVIKDGNTLIIQSSLYPLSITQEKWAVKKIMYGVRGLSRIVQI